MRKSRYTGSVSMLYEESTRSTTVVFVLIRFESVGRTPRNNQIKRTRKNPPLANIPLRDVTDGNNGG